MYGVFAAIGFTGVLATALLPETLGEDFPDTIADVEERRWNKFLSLRTWKGRDEKNDAKL